ncbi:FxsB family cyclophane-forming radical SAM/SPASM peptide maturase [Actinomadura sp. 9N215]|uniref:FxsB family cyclophane-forming radical SAM/SPASM peptide maturase n=1 Tax=Actinomadura sp. 9N215 TaxID=3375150 RepID=UPI0037B7BBAC
MVATPVWPDDLLDLSEVRRQGWRPLPFEEFVVKVHSRCNLSCDYCYMYEMADQSWRTRPVVMSRDTIIDTCRRIAEHARSHEIPAVRVVLHGGEPMLAGAGTFEFFAQEIRRSVGPDTTVEIGVQTNGVLIDERFLKVFHEHGIRVGVSLDGDSAGHDRHRRYASGRGSHDRVAEGLRLLSSDAHRDLFAGLLCTIDLDNDPIRTYEALAEWSPPRIDFLLPHGTWDAPPPRRSTDPALTPYADWLIAVFERWYGAPHGEPSVRFLDGVLRLLLGRPVRFEGIGLGPVGLLVIETDGTLEQVDTLKSAYAGAPETGLNVAEHPFDLALDHPSVVARQIGVAALADDCRSCPVRDVCGGGYYPHRYRAGTGFLNPSVYCPDLLKLITHVQDRVRADLLAHVGRRGPG